MTKWTMTALICTVFFAGCISYPVGGPGVTGGVPSSARAGKKTAVFCSISVEHYTVAISALTANEDTHALESELYRMLQESGGFVAVSARDRAELQISIRLLEAENPMLDLITSATSISTFGLIPTWATTPHYLVAEVVDSNGRVNRYELEDSARTVKWLPLLLAMPFVKRAPEVAGEVRGILLRNFAATLCDAHGPPQRDAMRNGD